MAVTDATPFITTEDLARRWQINKKTLLGAIHRDEVPCVKLGKRWLIPLAWVEAQEQSTAPDELEPVDA